MLAMQYWAVPLSLFMALKSHLVLSFSLRPPACRFGFSGPKFVSGRPHDNNLIRRFLSEQLSVVGVDEEFVPFPNCDIDAPGVVKTCMDALSKNSQPYSNAGLEVCFNFSSDRCRASMGGTLEEFIRFATNPTFGSMVDAQSWEVVSTGPIIEGTQTRGAMQTQLIDVIPMEGRPRRFLWSMQKERRPPRQGCWLVHECIFVDNAFALTE
mmetsp:Transcript_10110/g.14304  ORF Transcript_10110/g.14304 Transcript_10110/m.14304 type:complete len:210 (+) Transcript_10110:49-678(+)